LSQFLTPKCKFVERTILWKSGACVDSHLRDDQTDVVVLKTSMISRVIGSLVRLSVEMKMMIGEKF